MNLELLTIGTELLLGFTVDTNSAFAGQTLGAVGVRVTRRTTVPDQANDIRDALRDALARTGAVLVTGGLGPTRDDVTKRAVAEFYGVPLEFDEAVWAALLARYRTLGRTPADSNRTQAEVPRGAVVLPNPWGTAPGLWLDGAPGLTIMLPGVPIEMRNLLVQEVVPRLAARRLEMGGGTPGTNRIVIVSRLVRTTGIPESTLAERLDDLETAIAPLTLAYLPGLAGVDLRVTAWQLPPDEAERCLTEAVARLRARVGEYVYGEDDADLAAVVLEAARARGMRLATAESCTGGLVGARLTEIPGSSDVFLGGIVSYANDAKRELLDVPAALLNEHGAVSEPVARAMAVGARARFGADAAVAITGIAGPGGGSADKPVGTVWLAAVAGEAIETRHIVFPGTRAEIRARAAQAALHFMLRRLSGSWLPRVRSARGEQPPRAPRE